MHIFTMFFFLNIFKRCCGDTPEQTPIISGTCSVANCPGSEGGAVPFLSLFSSLVSKMKMAQADTSAAAPGAVQAFRVC